MPGRRLTGKRRGLGDTENWTQGGRADSSARNAKVLCVEASKRELVRRIVRPLVGYPDLRFIIVRDVVARLVQMHDVTLVCRSNVLDAPVGGLPKVGLEVLHDLSGAQELVYDPFDHREVIRMLEELSNALVNSLLHNLAQVGLGLVYRMPFPAP